MAGALQFDVQGLWQEWDQSESIRTSLREGKNLTTLIEAKDSTIAQRNLHADLLKPCLVRLLCSNLKLPDIEAVRGQVEEIYAKSQREVTTSTIDDDAWEIRKMMRLVKRKANRGDVSLDTLLDFIITCLRLFICNTCKDYSKDFAWDQL